MIQPLWRIVQRFLKKLGIKLLYNPAIPLLGICPEETIIENLRGCRASCPRPGAHTGQRMHVTLPRCTRAMPTALRAVGPANGLRSPRLLSPGITPAHRTSRPQGAGAVGCHFGRGKSPNNHPHPSVLAARLHPGAQLSAWPARGPGAAVDVYSGEKRQAAPPLLVYTLSWPPVFLEGPMEEGAHHPYG